MLNQAQAAAMMAQHESIIRAATVAAAEGTTARRKLSEGEVEGEGEGEGAGEYRSPRIHP